MFMFARLFLSALPPLPCGSDADVESAGYLWLQLMYLVRKNLSGRKTATEVDFGHDGVWQDMMTPLLRS